MARVESPPTAQIIVLPPSCPSRPSSDPFVLIPPVICYPSYSRASPTTRGRELTPPKGVRSKKKRVDIQ
eukprot:2022578-Pyramimonas_sp.AAC.1